MILKEVSCLTRGVTAINLLLLSYIYNARMLKSAFCSTFMLLKDLRVKRVDKCDWKGAGRSIKLNFTTFRTPR